MSRKCFCGICGGFEEALGTDCYLRDYEEFLDRFEKIEQRIQELEQRIQALADVLVSNQKKEAAKNG